MDTLEDLDFAYDIVMLAQRQQDIQRKTNDNNNKVNIYPG